MVDPLELLAMAISRPPINLGLTILATRQYGDFEFAKEHFGALFCYIVFTFDKFYTMELVLILRIYCIKKIDISRNAVMSSLSAWGYLMSRRCKCCWMVVSTLEAGSVVCPREFNIF